MCRAHWFLFLITPPGHTNKVATKVYAQWSLHYHGFIITGVQFLPSTLSNSHTGTLELYENFLAVDFNQDWLPFLSFKYTCYLFKTARPPQSRIKTDWWKGGFLFFWTSLSVMETKSFKAFGLDKLDPYFLKLVQDFIVEPLTDIYNLTPMNNKITDIWKK